MVSNPCSILVIIMISKLYFPSLFLIFSEAQNRNSASSSNSVENEYLFPGTGFFIKNRKPYDKIEAKVWFKEAYDLEKEQKESKSLKLYEKFSKRRSDVEVSIDGQTYQIVPESLFRAAKIRES